METEFHYILMSQQDLIKNQVIEEVIRERTNYCFERKQSLNFWIVLSPIFVYDEMFLNKISKTNFYKQKKEDILFENTNFFACVISTNAQYISWLKLRLGYFEEIENFEELNPLIKSDGICGTYDMKSSRILSPFNSIKNKVHPSLILEKYKTSVRINFQ